MQPSIDDETRALLAELKRWRLIAMVVAAICVPVGLMVIGWWLSKAKLIGVLIGGVPTAFGLWTAIQAHLNYTRLKRAVDEAAAKHPEAQ